MAYSYAGMLSRRGTIQVVIYKNPYDLEGKKNQIFGNYSLALGDDAFDSYL